MMPKQKNGFLHSDQRRLVYNSICYEWEDRTRILFDICKETSDLIAINQNQTNSKTALRFNVDENFSFGFNETFKSSIGFLLKTSNSVKYAKVLSHYFGSFFNCTSSQPKGIRWVNYSTEDLRTIQDIFTLVSLLLGKLFVFIPSIELPDNVLVDSDIDYLCQLSGLKKTQFNECKSTLNVLIGVSCLANYGSAGSLYRLNLSPEKYSKDPEMIHKNMANKSIKVKTNILARKFYSPICYSDKENHEYFESCLVNYAAKTNIALKEEFRKSYNEKFISRAIKRCSTLPNFKEFLKQAKHPALKYVTNTRKTGTKIRSIYTYGYLEKHGFATKGDAIEDISVAGLSDLFELYSEKLSARNKNDYLYIIELITQSNPDLIIERKVDIGSVRLSQNYKKTNTLLSKYKPQEHEYKHFLVDFKSTENQYLKEIETNKYKIIELKSVYAKTDYYIQNHNVLKYRNIRETNPVLSWLIQRFRLIEAIDRFLGPDEVSNTILHKIRNWLKYNTFDEFLELLIEIDCKINGSINQKLDFIFASIIHDAMHEALGRLSRRQKITSKDSLKAVGLTKKVFKLSLKYKDALVVDKELHKTDASPKVQMREKLSTDNSRLNNKQNKILSIIKLNPNTNQSDIAHLLNISKSTAYREMLKLQKLNIISRGGSKKIGNWIIHSS